jgi:hypothetical protein
VPSGKRSWSLPDNDGQEMKVELPFIYQPDLVKGVMHYLHQFFMSHTEQSLGDMMATFESFTVDTDDNGRPIYKLSYNVALAPYDLGVTQRVIFTMFYSEIVSSYRIELHNIRLSGQDTNWVTTNKPFLDNLRKLLMRWRNMDSTQHSWHIEQSENLTAESPTGTNPSAA